MKTPLAVASVALLLLLGAAPVQAFEESEASSLDARIVAVWHTPAVPEPGTQWQGFIQFTPGHNVTAVRYQICDVGNACFAPPTPATRLNETTWTFDTDNYRDPTFDRPILWGDASYSGGAPWRVGTQYFLTQSDGNMTVVPHGEDFASDVCKDRYRACAETHYIAWEMPAGRVGASEGAPGLGLVGILVAVAVVGAAVRKRRGPD